MLRTKVTVMCNTGVREGLPRSYLVMKLFVQKYLVLSIDPTCNAFNELEKFLSDTNITLSTYIAITQPLVVTVTQIAKDQVIRQDLKPIMAALELRDQKKEGKF